MAKLKTTKKKKNKEKAPSCEIKSVVSTAIADSYKLNQGKLEQLKTIAKALGKASEIGWDVFGSIKGWDWSVQKIRDYLHHHYSEIAEVPKKLVQVTFEAIAKDISLWREAIKENVWKQVKEKFEQEAPERLIYFLALNSGEWLKHPWLHRQVREAFNRGRTRVDNQIVYHPRMYEVKQTYQRRAYLTWLLVQGKEKGKRIAIPLSGNHPIQGTIRLIRNRSGLHRGLC
jgi:hypothetical protein